MVQKVVVKREFETGLRHETTGKLTLSAQQKKGSLFRIREGKTAKGEG